MARAQQQVAVVSRSDPHNSAVSAVLRCERQPVSTAERAELWGEGHGADEGAGLVFGAIGLRSRVRREALEYWSVTLLSLRPLRPLRSDVANDNRSLPQAVSTAERAESWGEKNGADEGPNACVGRHRASFQSSSRGRGVWVRDSAVSASSARSAVTCCRQAVPTAERAEEGHTPSPRASF